LEGLFPKLLLEPAISGGGLERGVVQILTWLTVITHANILHTYITKIIITHLQDTFASYFEDK
jgi:hypothetical protein